MTCSGTRSMSSEIGNFTRRMMTMPPVETAKTPTYSPGLDGVFAGETKLCHVDAGEGGLRYRGYAVSDLAEKATFEEVAYLLLFANLPTQIEPTDFMTTFDAQSVHTCTVEETLILIPI